MLLQTLDVHSCLLAPLCQGLPLLLLLTAGLLHGCFYVLPAECQQDTLLVVECRLNILLVDDQQDIGNTVQQDLLFLCMYLLKTFLVAALLCWTPPWMIWCSASGMSTRLYITAGLCQGCCKVLPADMETSSQLHHSSARNL